MEHDIEMKRYAAAFAYFLLRNMEKNWIEKICHIILFGSVAQGRATGKSDIDIFIDSKAPKSRLRQLGAAVRRAKEEFLLSKEALAYKANGIANEINVIVGNLAEWHEMKKSASAGGIVLFGPYTGVFRRKGLSAHILFYWEGAGKRRGAFLNKIYGYTSKGKKYHGMIQWLGGAKIGKGAALIPSENGQDFMKILQFYQIGYRALEVFV